MDLTTLQADLYLVCISILILFSLILALAISYFAVQKLWRRSMADYVSPVKQRTVAVKAVAEGLGFAFQEDPAPIHVAMLGELAGVKTGLTTRERNLVEAPMGAEKYWILEVSSHGGETERWTSFVVADTKTKLRRQAGGFVRDHAELARRFDARAEWRADANRIVVSIPGLYEPERMEALIEGACLLAEWLQTRGPKWIEAQAALARSPLPLPVVEEEAAPNVEALGDWIIETVPGLHQPKWRGPSP